MIYLGIIVINTGSILLVITVPFDVIFLDEFHKILRILMMG